jgi:hypothetical protein
LDAPTEQTLPQSTGSVGGRLHAAQNAVRRRDGLETQTASTISSPFRHMEMGPWSVRGIHPGCDGFWNRGPVGENYWKKLRVARHPVACVPVCGTISWREATSRHQTGHPALQGNRSRTGERLPHHRRNIERCPGGRTYPTFRGISIRFAQWIVRATPVGYEEFYVLLERDLFNPAPVDHIHPCQPAVTRSAHCHD